MHWLWLLVVAGFVWLCVATTFVAKCKTAYRIGCVLWRSRHQLRQTATVLCSGLMKSQAFSGMRQAMDETDAAHGAAHPAAPVEEGLPPQHAHRHRKPHQGAARKMKRPLL